MAKGELTRPRQLRSRGNDDRRVSRAVENETYDAGHTRSAHRGVRVGDSQGRAQLYGDGHLPVMLALLAAAALMAAPQAAARDVTFADVAPIVRARCVSCHKAGGDAPFSLES